ncbi:MAG: hypothetical protein COA44_05170 [Arcobacter sp.]|nr:MAG: hypothetical protein COA44_05170 [Arcobacter sp.]
MPEYIFSSQEKETEYKRLCLIQDSFDEKSKTHLKKAGLKANMDVLEVGLGAGSLASWLSEEVTDIGFVLGVDLNTEYVLDTKNYEVFEGNILDLETSKKFDLIHVRYVLIHNTSSKQILQRLHSLLKPEGILLIEEPDFTLAKWIDAKDLDGCKRVNSALCKMFESKGLKPYYGSVSHLSLEEVGFEIKDNKSYLHLCSGGEDVANLMYLSTKALQESYIQTGACSLEDIQAYLHACEDTESLGVYYATIAITARKSEILFDNKKDIELNPETNLLEDGVYQAREDDEIFACYDLMRVLRKNINADYFVAQIKEQMKEGYELFYLIKNNTVSCLAGCKVSNNLAWGKHLYILDLVSDTKERSLGYGKEILDYLKQRAKAQGCDEVHLDSGVQRFEAHKFYLREDFKIASHHFSYKIEI